MTERGETARAILGGVVAGLAAGAVLGAMRLATGAAPWLGDVVTHLAVSVAWGAAFGVIVYGLRPAITVAAGAAWGVLVWLVMLHVVLPLVGREIAVGSLAYELAEHTVFGIALALAFLPFQRHRHVRVLEEPAVQQQILPVF